MSERSSQRLRSRQCVETAVLGSSRLPLVAAAPHCTSSQARLGLWHLAAHCVTSRHLVLHTAAQVRCRLYFAILVVSLV